MSKLYNLNLNNFMVGEVQIKVHPFLFMIPPSLYHKGVKLIPSKGIYTLQDNENQSVTLKLIKKGIDPIPLISLNDDEPKNALTGFNLNFLDQLWCILPLFCLQISFSLGGFLIALLGVSLNIKLFHKYYHQGWPRFLYASLVTFFISIILILLMRLVTTH